MPLALAMVIVFAVPAVSNTDIDGAALIETGKNNDDDLALPELNIVYAEVKNEDLS